MKGKTIILILLFSLVGCSHHLIGKPAYNYRSFSEHGRGHHSFYLKHLIVQYDYEIDKTRGIINFKGNVVCNKNRVADWLNSEVELKFFFVNSAGLVAAVKSWNVLDTGELCTPKLFKARYRFSEEYTGVFVGYFIQMSE